MRRHAYLAMARKKRMIIQIDDYSYLIVFARRYAKAGFLKAAKVVPGSYAEELVERIYDSVVTYAVDLQEEYRKYYLDEYRNFGRFLYWKYEIPRLRIDEVMDSIGDESFVAYTRGSSGFLWVPEFLETVEDMSSGLEEVDDED